MRMSDWSSDVCSSDLKEPTLYVTLSESAAELKSVGLSHGWSFDGITIRELAASEEALRPDDQYTMFHQSEVELGETTRTILEEIGRASCRERVCKYV